MPSTAYRLGAVLCATVLGLLVAGCGGRGADDSAKPSATPAPPGTSAAPAPSAPPSSSASSGPALPEAADGTDLRACADSRCEVEVRAGDKITFVGDSARLKSFTVVRIAGDTLTHKAAGPPGYSFSGSMSASGTSVVNGLKVKIVAVVGDRAVVNLS